MNIEIEKRVSAIPGVYTPKPYRMTIKVPLHNYMVTKRTTDPPYILLSKDDLEDMFKAIGDELGYNTKELYYAKKGFEMVKEQLLKEELEKKKEKEKEK